MVRRRQNRNGVLNNRRRFLNRSQNARRERNRRRNIRRYSFRYNRNNPGRNSDLNILRGSENHSESVRALANGKSVFNMSFNVLLTYTDYDEGDERREPRWRRYTNIRFSHNDPNMTLQELQNNHGRQLREHMATYIRTDANQNHLPDIHYINMRWDASNQINNVNVLNNPMNLYLTKEKIKKLIDYNNSNYKPHPITGNCVLDYLLEVFKVFKYDNVYENKNHQMKKIIHSEMLLNSCKKFNIDINKGICTNGLKLIIRDCDLDIKMYAYDLLGKCRLIYPKNTNKKYIRCSFILQENHLLPLWSNELYKHPNKDGNLKSLDITQKVFDWKPIITEDNFIITHNIQIGKLIRGELHPDKEVLFLDISNSILLYTTIDEDKYNVSTKELKLKNLFNTIVIKIMKHTNNRIENINTDDYKFIHPISNQYISFITDDIKERREMFKILQKKAPQFVECNIFRNHSYSQIGNLVFKLLNQEEIPKQTYNSQTLGITDNLFFREIWRQYYSNDEISKMKGYGKRYDINKCYSQVIYDFENEKLPILNVMDTFRKFGKKIKILNGWYILNNTVIMGIKIPRCKLPHYVIKYLLKNKLIDYTDIDMYSHTQLYYPMEKLKYIIENIFEVFGLKMGKKLVNILIGSWGCRYDKTSHNSMIISNFDLFCDFLMEYGNEYLVNCDNIGNGYYSVELNKCKRLEEDTFYIRECIVSGSLVLLLNMLKKQHIDVPGSKLLSVRCDSISILYDKEPKPIKEDLDKDVYDTDVLYDYLLLNPYKEEKKWKFFDKISIPDNKYYNEYKMPQFIHGDNVKHLEKYYKGFHWGKYCLDENTLIKGGPGVGKSFDLLNILNKQIKLGKKVLVVSFTNSIVNKLKKEYERMFEYSDDYTFSTIHSFLNIFDKNNKIKPNNDSIVSKIKKYDIVIIDEVNNNNCMILSKLKLFKKIKPEIKLFLFGDKNQHRPINNFGNIKYDLDNSYILNDIFGGEYYIVYDKTNEKNRRFDEKTNTLLKDFWKTGKLKEELLNECNFMSEDEIDFNYNDNLCVCKTNKKVIEINEKYEDDIYENSIVRSKINHYDKKIYTRVRYMVYYIVGNKCFIKNDNDEIVILNKSQLLLCYASTSYSTQGLTVSNKNLILCEVDKMSKRGLYVALSRIKPNLNNIIITTPKEKILNKKYYDYKSLIEYKCNKLERWKLYKISGKNDDNIYIGITSKKDYFDRILEHFETNKNDKYEKIVKQIWKNIKNINHTLIGEMFVRSRADAERIEQTYIYQYYHNSINKDKYNFIKKPIFIPNDKKISRINQLNNYIKYHKINGKLGLHNKILLRKSKQRIYDFNTIEDYLENIFEYKLSDYNLVVNKIKNDNQIDFEISIYKLNDPKLDNEKILKTLNKYTIKNHNTKKSKYKLHGNGIPGKGKCFKNIELLLEYVSHRSQIPLELLKWDEETMKIHL